MVVQKDQIQPLFKPMPFQIRGQGVLSGRKVNQRPATAGCHGPKPPQFLEILSVAENKKVIVACPVDDKGMGERFRRSEYARRSRSVFDETKAFGRQSHHLLFEIISDSRTSIL